MNNATGAGDVFLQLGAIGALALLLLWFAAGAYRREVKRADEAEAEVRELNREFRDKYVPALTTATQALVEAARGAADMASLLRERR